MPCRLIWAKLALLPNILAGLKPRQNMGRLANIRPYYSTRYLMTYKYKTQFTKEYTFVRVETDELLNV